MANNKENRMTTLIHEGNEREVLQITLGNTAKLLKAKLNEVFPGVRFSIKSRWSFYHPTIDVFWEDHMEPTRKAVEAIADPFIGQQDCKTLVNMGQDGKPFTYEVEWIILHHDDATTATKTFTVGLEERIG